MGRKYCPHGFPIQDRFQGMLRFRVVEKDFVEIWEVKARTFDTFVNRIISDFEVLREFAVANFGEGVEWHLNYKGDCEADVMRCLHDVVGGRLIVRGGGRVE